MKKYLLIPILCLLACDGASPTGSTGTPATTTTKTSTALYETATDVGALKALLPATRSANTLYYVQGYYLPGDGGNGLLEWRPTSMATPDDILVFLPNDLTVSSPGRYHQVIENGSFDAKRGGLKPVNYDTTDVCMATTTCVGGDYCCPNGCTVSSDYDCTSTAMGAKLQAIYAAVNSAQIGELYLSAGRYDVRDGITLGYPTNGAHTSIRGAGIWVTTLYGGQGHSDDPNHPAQLLLSPGVFGHSSWIQPLTAGDRVLHNTGLSMPYPGERVYLELGADNTDQGQPYLVMMTQIQSVSGTDVTIADPVPETIPPYSNTVVAANQNFISEEGIAVEGVEISNLTTDLMLVALDKVTNVSIHDMSVKRGTSTFSFANVWNVSFTNIVADHIYGYALTPPLGVPAYGWYGWFLLGWKAYGLHVNNVTINYLEGESLFAAESQTRDVSLENIHVYMDGGRLIGNSALIVGGNQSTAPAFPGTAAQITPASDTILVKDLHLDLGPGTSGMGGPSVRFENLEINGTSTAIPNFGVNLSSVDGDLKWGGQFFNQRIPFSTYIPLNGGPSTVDYPLPVTGLIGKMRTYVSTLTNVSFVGVGYTGTGWVASDQSELVAGQWVENQIPTSTASGYPNFQIGTKFVRVTTTAALPAGSYMIVEGESLASDPSLVTRPATTKAGAGAPTVSADYIGQEYFDYTNSRFYKAVTTGGGSTDWVLE